MQKLLVVAAIVAGFAFVSPLAAEEGIADEPTIRGWAMMQEGPVVTFDKDVVRGDIIPDTIKLAEIPDFPQYGFVILNTERVIVDPATRKVIAVY
jgi:hypothetical protein